jgi:hypothetical protein
MLSSWDQEIVKEVIALIDKGWCQSRFACDEKGQTTSWWKEDACQFCAEGAFKRILFLKRGNSPISESYLTPDLISVLNNIDDETNRFSTFFFSREFTFLASANDRAFDKEYLMKFLEEVFLSK